MNLQDFRQQFPQYGDLSDQQLAEGLHQKYYADIPFDQFSKEVGLTKSNSITDTAKDLGNSIKRGVEELPGVVTGVADIPSALVFGTKPFDTISNYVGEKTGFQPGKWAEDAKNDYSPHYQQEQQAIEHAWQDPNTSALDVAKAYVENPSYTANQVAESLPSMLAGGAAGRALMVAGRTAEGAGVLERAVGNKLAAPIAGGAGEGSIQAGQQMDQYKGDDQRKNAVAAVGSGLIDAVIGAGAGRVANKLGLETAETALAKGFDDTLKSELSLGKRVAGGAVSEGLLQELPQSAQEQVWQNYADNKPLWDGVNRSAIEGALAGFAMGAGANIRTGKLTGDHLTVDNSAVSAAQDDAVAAQLQADYERQQASSNTQAALEGITKADNVDDAITLAHAAMEMPLTPKASVESLPPEAINASDLLGEQNVSQPNDVTGVAAEASQPQFDNSVGSLTDILPPAGSGVVHAGQPGSTGTPGQSDVGDLVAGNGSAAQDSPIAPGEVQAKVDVGTGMIVTSTGDPYKSEATAMLSLKAKGLMGKYQVTPVDGGYALQKTEMAGPVAQNDHVVDTTDMIPSAPEVSQAKPNDTLPAESNIRPAETAQDTRQNQEQDLGVSTPPSTPQASEDPVLRPMIERLVKRRAVSWESGFENKFDGVLARAKKAMRGEDVPHNYFRLAAKQIGLKDKETGAIVEEIGNHIKNRPAITSNDLGGAKINDKWTAFAPDTGTLGIPRADMPQVKAEHRGALVNFLNARGISHEQTQLPAGDLKPTQAEFSPEKVKKAKDYTDTDRSILISSDNHVVDGHHQWLAKMDKGEPISAIRLNAPIKKVLQEVKAFPSAETAGGATSGNSPISKPNSVSDKTNSVSNNVDTGSQGNQPAKLTEAKAKVQPVNQRIEQHRAVLSAWLPDMDWSQHGGHIIRGEDGEVASRTTWEPKDYDFNAIRNSLGISFKTMREAMQKALDGGKLSSKQKGIVDALLDFADEMQAPGNNEIAAVNDALSFDEEHALEQLSQDIAWQSQIAEFAADDSMLVSIGKKVQNNLDDFERLLGAYYENIETEAGNNSVAGQADTGGQGARNESGFEPGQDEDGTNAARQSQADSGSKSTKLTSPSSDLFGQDNSKAQAVADAERAKDLKRNSGESQSDFALTGSDRPADEAAARGAQDLFSNSHPISQSTKFSPETKSNDNAAEQPKVESSAPEQGSQQQPATPKAETAVAAAPISDFGEKIGGAKKDLWHSYADKLSTAEDLDIRAVPLSQSWPEPDYEKLLAEGADPWAVSFMHAARDEIPTKPSKPYKQKAWADQVEILRKVAQGLADGSLSVANAQTKLNDLANTSRGLSDIRGRMDLYQLVGHSQSLKGVRVSVGSYSIYNGVEYKPSKTIWSVEKETKATAFSNWPRQLAIGDTREQALQQFKAKFADMTIQPQASKEVSFDIYSKRGQDGFFIGKKVGRNYIDLEKFATVKEAREYKRENNEALVAKLEKLKEIPSVRRETNEPRVGEDMRDGKDVTPELFANSFGFKGVEFGNYVEGKKRQQDLNDAFDALMDMAAILDVPPKALSLNGELSLAFGARGTGGIDPAAAHYERDFVVINLTKKSGAGSLGHEWWHALDNYFSRMRNQQAGMMTDALDVSLASRGSEFVANTAVRKEMIAAYGEVMRAIKSTALKARSSKLDAKRSKEYWTTNVEMTARAFESYLISKLQDQNASNDYLANIVDDATWKAAEGLGFELDESYPYPTAGEMPTIRAAYDHFFNTIESKETDKGTALFSRSQAQTNTPEFKKWFGDSKVVDAEGKPLVVYHGTSKDFTEFDPDRTGDSSDAGYLGTGVYFAAEPNIASGYAKTDGGNVLPVYLTIKNPFIWKGGVVERVRQAAQRGGISAAIKTVAGVDTPEASAYGNNLFSLPIFSDTRLPNGLHERMLKEAGVTQGQLDELSLDKGGRVGPEVNSERAAMTRKLGDALRSVLERDGYDGIIATNPKEGITYREYVAFRPEQIKSAIGNNGDFNAANPDINMSRGIGQGMAKDDVQKTVDAIRAGWVNAPEIVVVQDMQDPAISKYVRDENERQLSQGATGQPEGFFDHGKVYIVASELSSPDDVARVLMHETLGHYGLRGTFGNALDNILDEIYMIRRPLVTAKAKQYGLDFTKRSDRLIAAEEVLAEMAQNNPQLGFVKRAIAAIRTWLRNNVPYFKNMTMTDAEIVRNFLEPARQFVQNGQKELSTQDMVAAFQRNQREPSSTAGDTVVTAAMEYLARDPELFQRPLTETKDIYGIAKELDPGYRVEKLGPSMTKEKGADRAWEVFVPDSKVRSGTIYTKEGEVWIDVSRLVSGKDRGSAVYDMAAAYAHNNGKVLIGDPLGLSRMALYRRNENMLSSALKYGTTKHLQPHLAQEVPSEYFTGHEKAFGESVRPLNWIEGDDANNIKELVYNSWDSAIKNVPELKDVIYDPESQQFQYTDGRPFTAEDSQRIAAELSRTASPYRSGSATLKRAALFNTFLRSEGKEGRRQLLGELVAQLSRDGLAPALRGIMYSRSNQTSLTPQWEDLPESKFDSVIYALQDKNIDLKRVTQNIKKAVGDISDRWNAYLQEELYHGRTAKRVQDFIKTELEPLINDMRLRGVTMADFEEYLWARHAAERNAQIAKVNPDMPDGGSGLTDKEAQDILDSIDPKKLKAYEALAKRVDAINQGSRQVLLDYGLESADTIAAWQSAYKHYVPLQREDMDTGFGNGTGQGFSVKGNSSKRATGSGRKVVDILANMAQQREKNIIRGEKNRVSTALIGLAKLNPNPDFWDTDSVPTIKQIGASGMVEERPDPNYKSRDNVIVARIANRDGRITEHAVIFNQFDERAMRMAASLKNLDQDQIGEWLGKLGLVTRYFSSINTQYNPIFGVLNIVRDVQDAALNLSSTPLAGKQKEVVKHVPAALRGIYIDIRSQRKGESNDSVWAQLWEEFQREGGQTGYRDQYQNARMRAEAIERALDPDWWQKTKIGKVITAGGALAVPEKYFNDKAVKPFFEWLSDYNETLENAVRLSAYKAAKEQGMTNQQAASLAKNISVNFNRKGQQGRILGALYAFFNASMQGMARSAETLKGPAGKRIIAGGIMLGVMQALALAAAGFDDNEPPEFMRDRNIIIPIGDGKYLTIPMPLGYLIFPALGRIATEYVLGGYRDSGKHVTHLAGVFMDALNPIGGNGSLANIVTPTMFDPLIDLGNNKDFTGRPIAKPDFNSLDPTPGYTRAKDTASAFGKGIAYAVNRLSGGSDYKPGALSPTPDQIDYLIGQATGGVGREAMKVEQTASSMVTGEELPTYKVPLVGRFYGDSHGKASQASEFYDNIRELNEHENEIKGRRKDHQDTVEYRHDHPEAALISQGKLIYKSVSALRKREREMEARGASKEQVKEIEVKITERMAKLNERMRAKRELSASE